MGAIPPPPPSFFLLLLFPLPPQMSATPISHCPFQTFKHFRLTDALQDVSSPFLLITFKIYPGAECEMGPFQHRHCPCLELHPVYLPLFQLWMGKATWPVTAGLLAMLSLAPAGYSLLEASNSSILRQRHWSQLLLRAPAASLIRRTTNSRGFSK